MKITMYACTCEIEFRRAGICGGRLFGRTEGDEPFINLGFETTSHTRDVILKSGMFYH